MTFKKTSILSLIALVAVGLALSVVTAGVLSAQKTITSNGSVKGNVASSINIGVYSDAAATIPFSNVSWGTLSPGSSVNQVIYVKNTGTTSEKLSLGVNGWNPSSAASSLTLSWNKEGSSLAAGDIVPATLTLTVGQDAGALSSFSFNIVVSGSA